MNEPAVQFIAKEPKLVILLGETVPNPISPAEVITSFAELPPLLPAILTAYAATIASEKVASEVVSMGLASVSVRVKGPGAGRESAIRALSGAGLQVTSISDVTPLPHNGCRPKKQRRV